jgi:AraC-like DNA-binding protein/quercetin dioxygenase-like cupin family protein
MNTHKLQRESNTTQEQTDDSLRLFLHAPLSEAEQMLKACHEAQPERRLHTPARWDEVCDLVMLAFAMEPDFPDLPIPMNSKVMSLGILNQIFIGDEMDAALFRHARYLPSFWHRHESIAIMCVLTGQCRHTIANHEEILCAGDICIFPPDTTHAISTFHDDDLVVHILMRPKLFEAFFMDLMEEDTILSNFYQRAFHSPEDIPYLLFHAKDDRRIITDLYRAYTEYHTDFRCRRQMVNAILQEFLISLVRSHESTLEIPAFSTDDRTRSLMTILHYMQDHYRSVTLKELAARFDYSERQLQRIIVSSTGISFSENIQKQKMKEAADLLRNTELPITKIGEQIGYASPNNFRKIFYNHYHLTPSEYRNGAGNRLVNFASFLERR